MSYTKRFLGKLFLGSSFFLLFAIAPAFTIYASDQGALLFGVWFGQLLLVTPLLIVFRKTLTHWIWVIVIGSTGILAGPVLGTQWPYLWLGVGGEACEVEATSLKSDPAQCGWGRVVVAKQMRIDIDGAVNLRIEDNWVERDPETRKEIQRSNVETYAFVPLKTKDEAEGPIWALLDWRQAIQDRFPSAGQTAPNIYLVPGPWYLERQARMVFDHPDTEGHGAKLSPQLMTAVAAYPDQASMDEDVADRHLSAGLALLALWAGFVLIPALLLGRRKSQLA